MVPPCVVLVINDNHYGIMFALRYPYRSCPYEILEFMSGTREALMKASVTFNDFYQEWSSVDLSILQVRLEAKDQVVFHDYLQDIIKWREKKRYKVDQACDQHTKLQDVPNGLCISWVW